jgi:hypothetical protein
MEKRGNVIVIWSYVAILFVAFMNLSACTAPAPSAPLPYYRCEHGVEFTARFIDESVALDSNRGYEILQQKSKDKNEFSNSRMAVAFGLGGTGREAVLRFPLLPLIARCVRDN